MILPCTTECLRHTSTCFLKPSCVLLPFSCLVLSWGVWSAIAATTCGQPRFRSAETFLIQYQALALDASASSVLSDKTLWHTVSAQEYHAGCTARGCTCVAQYCVVRHAQRREHAYSAGGHKQGPHKTASAVDRSDIVANTSRDAPVSAAKNTPQESRAIIEQQCCGFCFRTAPRQSKEWNKRICTTAHVICCSVLQCAAV